MEAAVYLVSQTVVLSAQSAHNAHCAHCNALGKVNRPNGLAPVAPIQRVFSSPLFRNTEATFLRRSACDNERRWVVSLGEVESRRDRAKEASAAGASLVQWHQRLDWESSSLRRLTRKLNQSTRFRYLDTFTVSENTSK